MTTTTTQHLDPASINAAIVDHVRMAGSCLYAELYPLFGLPESGESDISHDRFRKKLEYLCYHERLTASRHRGLSRTFSLGALADQDIPALSATTAAEIEQRDLQRTLQHAAPLVPPPQINVMHADWPVYRPGPRPAVRPGADDHRRYETHGVRC
jgi:hypothetical protein